MPYYCTVPRCTSMAGKAKNVSFHQFPRDEELATLWNKILKRGKPYTKYSKVCSLHFKPEDYTITSVGKNKGQWRTLRKDAIPSQNLPSESPTPYHRKQWSCWSATPPVDTNLQQQMAQAIYMQTMLAMQAAGSTDIHTTSTEGAPTAPTLQNTPHTSSDTPNPPTHTPSDTPTSYKCTECSKCFKDPDVFILHKRTHNKNEKENFNTNMLQSNPILANLLKTNSENHIFDSTMSMENLLMTALAANLDYIRKMSMIKTETPDFDNQFGDNHNGATVENHNGSTTDNHNGFPLPNGFSHNHNGFFPETQNEYSSNNGFVNHNRFSANNGSSSNNHNRFPSQNHNGFPHNDNGFESHNEIDPPEPEDNDRTHMINENENNENTEKYAENNQNSDNLDRYRINVRCTDFQVHDKGFLDLRNKKNDIATNDRFAKNDSCDNDDLNESFDSSNLVIDENV